MAVPNWVESIPQELTPLAVPSWVESVAQENIPLSASDYYWCFHAALARMAKFLYGKKDRYEFGMSHRDSRIADDEAARSHFYSDFSVVSSGGITKIHYKLSQAFFTYTYRGLFNPGKRLKQSGEDDTTFLKHCATNYLVKNFWHNYVHDKMQRITDTNYHKFRQEARHFSDFEADNFANILLPLSYGIKVAADHTTQYHSRPEIADLFARNRCNTVFIDRATARGDFPTPGGSYDELLDWEWLIRRRLANQLTMLLIERNRAVSSITMHFFGDVEAKSNKFTRPKVAASVELNGVRFPLKNMANVGALADDNIRKATPSYVTYADVEYCTELRDNAPLRKYALSALRAKCEFLLDRPVNGLIVEATKLDLADGREPPKRRNGNRRSSTS